MEYLDIAPNSNKDSKYQLDPFQKNAIQSIQSENSLLVSAPTGSGKTVIAEYAVEYCLAHNKRLIYTAPIKALSNQKFRDFGELYPNQVGIVTGDVSINPNAQVLVMTTEIFRNCIFENRKRLEDVGYVIFDEIHFINDEERGTVWEESIIFTPPHIQIICLSATVPNLMDLAEWIVSVRQCPLDVVKEPKRPVPLSHYLYTKSGVLGVKSLRDPDFSIPPRKPGQKFLILEHLIKKDHLPALIFCFNRKNCERKAYQMKDARLNSPSETSKIDLFIEEFLEQCEEYPYMKEAPILQILRNGVGYHHAGMLPLLKELVERLFSTGLIKMLFTTETFAMGVNMPACSVVFTELKRWNGSGLNYIQSGSYHQMAGRAGRRGMDEVGYVYAPLFGGDNKNHERVYDLITGEIEPINSQFNLSYCTLLNLYTRLGNGLMEACDKSLRMYLKTKNATDEERQEYQQETHKEVRKKLKILNKLSYIKGTELTQRGFLASKINGYELYLTEFYYSGLYEDLSTSEIAILMNSIVFEGKRSVWYLESETEQSEFVQTAKSSIEKVHKLEDLYQISNPVKSLDFRLAEAIKAWVEGCTFEDLSSYTSCSPGDFVRTTRMTIQLLKQLSHAVPEHSAFRERLNQCIFALKRDQVDAEQQLRMEQ